MLFWKCFHAQVSTLWAIDILTMLQQLLKYPVQVFSPAVITHPILARHMTTHHQNHFYDVTLSPDAYCLSCQSWNIAYTVHRVDIVFSNSGMCHYHRYTLNTHTWLFSQSLSWWQVRWNIQKLFFSQMQISRVYTVNEKYIKGNFFYFFYLTFPFLQCMWKKIYFVFSSVG